MFLIQGAFHEPLKESKSSFQALEPRAGARSQQGGQPLEPGGSQAGSLDCRGTWGRCGLACQCPLQALLLGQVLGGQAGRVCLTLVVSQALLA